ncbi:MAG: Lrp/AsnC family transcriptional regulator [Methanobacteriota archaeon]|nr:MAG: Lrp/AsnC family transcriptional regulator [Euryarchaeota archaeon]
MALDFTSTEKIVLYGLVKHPTLNDRQLSELIGVKPSTTTAIRTRLRQKDVFRTKRIPIAHKLGYELLVTVFGSMEPGVKESDRKKFSKWIRGIPGVFLSLESSNSMFFTGYFKNFSEYRSVADEAWEKFGESTLFQTDKWYWPMFSFARSKLVNFFDYSSPLRFAFKIKEKAKVERERETLSKERLTRKERTVLQGLINYPEISDKAVAEKIGASRQAVASMRKRFEEKGILRTIRIVDMEKVGYQILAVGSIHFQPKASLNSRWIGVERTVETVPMILNVASSPETVVMSYMKDYEEYHATKKEALEFYAKSDFYREEPTSLIFPLSDTKITKDFDFSRFMERFVQEED